MRIAICPPEYFPRSVFFSAILQADVLVLDDTVQYSRQSWHNRTRLRNADGWQWLTVPVGHGQFGNSLRDMAVKEGTGWQTRHRKALKFNYESAPYYAHYAHRLIDFWAQPWTNLAACTCKSVELLVDMMRLPVEVRIKSGFDVLEGERVDVVFPREEVAYRQNFDGWIPGQSAIDLIMNSGPNAHRVLMDQCR